MPIKATAAALGLLAFSISASAQITVVDSTPLLTQFFGIDSYTIRQSSGTDFRVGPAFLTGNQAASISTAQFGFRSLSGGETQFRLSLHALDSLGLPSVTALASAVLPLPTTVGVWQPITFDSGQLGALASVPMQPSTAYTLIVSARATNPAGFQLAVADGFDRGLYTFAEGFSHPDTGDLLTPDGGSHWQVPNDTPYFRLQIAYLQQLLSALATEQSMQGNRDALRSAFALAASYLNPGLSHDCSTFGTRNLCVAFTGKRSSGARDVDATTGALTLAFRPTQRLRVGGFVEQRSGDVTDQGVRLRQGQPDVGMFGVWSENENNLGTQVRLAYRRGKQDLDITRSDVGGAEVGSGSSGLSSRGFQITASHGFPQRGNVVVRPYAGLREIEIQRAGYTESNAIASPLTYDPLRYRATQVLAGAQVSYGPIGTTRISGSFGIERDVNRRMSDYSASGVAGLGPLDFGASGSKTRPVLSLGLSHQIAPNQQLAAEAHVRREAWSGHTTRTALVSYSVGF